MPEAGVPIVPRIIAMTVSGHPCGADAAEDADKHHHRRLPEGEIDAEKLREKEDGDPFKEP